MKELDIAAFVPQSKARWRGRTAAEIFVAGCNFHCGYCYSYPIIKSPEKAVLLKKNYVIEKLLENSRQVSSVVITGGEPLLQGDSLIKFARELKDCGFGIKLETNGSSSFVLEKLFYNDLLDYVAMDFKNQLNEYSYFKIIRKRVDMNQIIRSAQFVRHYAPDYEFTITFVPKLHSFRDIMALSRQLKGSKRFVLQEFIHEYGTLDKFLKNSRKTNYEQLLSMAKQIRGIEEVRIKTRKGEEIVNQIKARDITI